MGTCMTDAWKKEMEKHWKDVLSKNRPEIARIMNVGGELINHLESRQIFNKRACKSFLTQPGKYAQASAILEALSKRPFEDFLKFCDVLHVIHQEHIVRDYLITSRPLPRQHSAPVTGQSFVEMNESNASPLQDQWKDMIQKNYSSLIDQIDPDNGLWNILVSSGVIVEWMLDTFKFKRGRSNRVSALLDHLVKRPYEDFLKFRYALAEVNQQHIVQEYLTLERSVGDTKPDSVPGHHPQVSDPSTKCSFHSTDWKKVFVEKRTELVEDLDVGLSSGLLGHLLQFNVINQMSYEYCQEEPDEFLRGEYIVDHMRKRTDEDFFHFCEALKSTNQSFIIDKFFNEPMIKSEQPSDERSPDEQPQNMLSTNDEKYCYGDIRLQGVSHIFQHQAGNVDMKEAKNLNMKESTVHPSHPIDQTPGSTAVLYHPVDETPGEFFIGEKFRMAASGDPSEPRIIDLHMTNEPMPEISTDPGEEYEVDGPADIIDVSVKPSTEQFYQDQCRNAYTMNKYCRGKCIIINIHSIEGLPARDGTQKDGCLLTELFKKLHFQIIEMTNPIAEEIRKELEKISQDQTLQDDQCLVIFVLSHGGVHTIDNRQMEFIYGSDRRRVLTDSILEPFTEKKCPFLKKKPKLVFFQACRGQHYDQPDSDAVIVEQTESLTVSDAPQTPLSYNDFLIAYPTQSEFRSFRNTLLGSWYINAIVRVFQKNVHNTGICSMLNMVNGMMCSWISRTPGCPESNNKRQVAMYTSNFTKADLYFFPGIVKE